MTLIETRFKKLAVDLSSLIGKLKVEASAKVVHRLRTTTRRMEAFIEYLRPKLTRKQTGALNELMVLRRRAGKVRDLDVQVDLLQQGIGNGSATMDRNALVQAMQAKRDRQAMRLVVTAHKIEGSKLFTHLQKIEAKAVRQPDSFGIASTPFRQAETQLTQMAAEFVSHTKLKPRRLHALRKRLKVIRYQAELGAESQEQKQFVEQLKSVQDALGEWHDWDALCAAAEKFFRDRANCPLLVEARAILASKYAAAISAVTSLLSSNNPARKRPSNVRPVASIARPA
jgi:CHAD domain-containing protein